MAKVVLSIPKLGITTRSGEKNKEVYVLALASDGRGKDETRGGSFPIAAYNETLPLISPEITNHGLLKYFVCSVSNTFQRIRFDQEVSLSGSGIILYPNLDPKGILSLHFVVIESDKEKRDIGKFLSSIFDDSAVGSLLEELSKGFSQPIVANIFNTVTSLIPRFLKENGDDYLFGHNHSGFAFDNYGVDCEDNVQDFQLKNDLAFCTLRVRVNKDNDE
jgi:hypothetical protein